MSNIAGKIGLSVVTAVAGGAAWLVAEPSAKSVISLIKPAASAAPAADTAPAGSTTAAPLVAGAASTSILDAVAPDLSLAASMGRVIEIAKAARRPDTELVALTAASARLAELNEKVAALGPGDGAARALLAEDLNEVALAAARVESAALMADADRISSALRSDFQTAEMEQKAAGGSLDADTLAAKMAADDAQAVILAAVTTSGGTDAVAALSAVSGSAQAIVTLASLRPAAQAAFVKSKRASFGANIAASRNLAQEIAVEAGKKKASAFASRERKADSKYLQDTDAWARGRLAELDQLAPSIAAADRKALSQYAAKAAAARTELQAALENCKAAAARLAN